MKEINNFRKPKVSWLMSETLNQRRVQLTSWPGTRQEIHALESVTHTTVCDILWTLHQLLDVFWCLKCFESGIPGTGDTGRKNHHQSPGCQRERHSILAFWDSSCPLRSCSVTFRVSASRRWRTRPEVVGFKQGHKQVVFYFIQHESKFNTFFFNFEVSCASSANATCTVYTEGKETHIV